MKVELGYPNQVFIPKAVIEDKIVLRGSVYEFYIYGM